MIIHASKVGNLYFLCIVKNVYFKDSVDQNRDGYQGLAHVVMKYCDLHCEKSKQLKKLESNKVRDTEKVRRTLKDPTMNKFPPRKRSACFRYVI